MRLLSPGLVSALTLPMLMTLPFLLTLQACASYPPPTERVTTSEAAIRAADEVGARQVPRAALHLKLAQEQTDKARQLMQDGYNERAEQTLKRAQADAELALAISRENATSLRLLAAQTKLEELQRGRASGGAR